MVIDELTGNGSLFTLLVTSIMKNLSVILEAIWVSQISPLGQTSSLVSHHFLVSNIFLVYLLDHFSFVPLRNETKYLATVSSFRSAILKATGKGLTCVKVLRPNYQSFLCAAVRPFLIRNFLRDFLK